MTKARRVSRAWRGLLAALLAAAFVLAACHSTPSGTAPRAVIVDQLDLSSPNRDFIAGAKSDLEQAGYVVDYVAGDAVTIDALRRLPEKNYVLVIIRMHSGLLLAPDGKSFTHDLTLFTAEPYSNAKYVDQQIRGELVLYNELDKEYFAVTPEFVRSGMHGKFHGTTVLLMGCEGLTHTNMASALVARGAKDVIGWDDFVVATHTDAGARRLVQHLLAGETAATATTKTMDEIGPDPVYSAHLHVYAGR